MPKPFSCDHPIVHWLFEHAAGVLSKYVIDGEGRTPYGKLHGREARERLCEFGVRFLFDVPKQSRAKTGVRWRYGFFIGRAMASDQNIIALGDGSVTRARAMVRVVPSQRWDADKLSRLTATPFNEKQASLDSIEQEANPHEHAQSEQSQDEPDTLRARRGLKIELRHLGMYGYTKGCRKCSLHSQNRHAAAHKEHHTEECRARIYGRMKAAGAKKYLEAEKADQERLQARGKNAKEAPHEPPVAELHPPDPAGPSSDLEAASDALNAGDSMATEPLPAEAGIDIEDTSFLMPDNPAESNDHARNASDDIELLTEANPDTGPDAMQEDAVDADMLIN